MRGRGLGSSTASTRGFLDVLVFVTRAAPPREAGARLAVREMHGFWNWLVSEAEVHARKPAPVCLADGSSVILRPSGKMQKKWNIAPEEKAVFRMTS